MNRFNELFRAQYYGQGWVDKYIHETFFDGYRNGFFIEAGAFDGLVECTCKFFEETMGWKGINVEADSNHFQGLVRNRPNTTNLHLALSSPDNSGSTLTFKYPTHPQFGRNIGQGSLSHVESHIKELTDKGYTFVEEKVECISYSELIKKNGVTKVDLFVLDIEGHELEVIKGMHGSVIPNVLCVEHGHVGLDNLKKILEPLGLKFHSQYQWNVFFTK